MMVERKGGMTSEELTQLRNQVLDELMTLVDEVDIEPEDKYNILMSRYIATGDNSLLKTSLEAAKKISDPKARGSAFVQLLGEIDANPEVNPPEAENQDLPPQAEQVSETQETSGPVPVQIVEQ